MSGEVHEQDRHFACTLTSVLLRYLRKEKGDGAVAEALRLAGSKRSFEYLDEVSNWVSYNEAIALFDAAEQLTGDPHVARHVGEETVRQHAGTPVATLLRSLGSPDEIYQKMALTAGKFSTLATLSAVEAEPGRAVISSRPHPDFERHRHHCNWTGGLLSQPTVLFGLAPATVEETRCVRKGDPECVYTISWDRDLAALRANPAEHVTALEAQLATMSESLESVYATAGELIAGGDLDTVLARITERAATAVRAPRYLLAVRVPGESTLRCQHRGFSASEARVLAEGVLSTAEGELPPSWLAADVTSHQNTYGRLVAFCDEQQFFPQERQLWDLYARYAASALDGATALADAERRHNEARALLELARALAAAGTSDEVAARLAEAVSAVVDCDRVGVFLWDEQAQELAFAASWGAAAVANGDMSDIRIRPSDTPLLADLTEDPEPNPIFLAQDSSDRFVRKVLQRFAALSLIAMPIVAHGNLLGLLTVAVHRRRERLDPRQDLLDRLSGVAAHAASALENGRLIDRVTHQARHDGLTGLANRAFFAERIEVALGQAQQRDLPVGLFFVDLDGFKAVNDERGHAVGDELLCQVASRLLDTVRSTDTVARLGGDEFAIVLSDAGSRAELDAAAARVAAAFDEPFEVAGESLSVGASIGRAIWPQDASEIEALMRHADAEMYRAKRSAR
ncbi:MAG TPA: sensor domain-containing diguanylate cyclase [Thermoleophilaceae bacterium]|nr:sensor domain-containing diguanylate cyclase [Thermoleophilaceae bacterium]